MDLRNVIVHVNDEPVSRHAVHLAAALASGMGATLTAMVVAPPAVGAVGLSPETASLAVQADQERRKETLALCERLAAEARQRFGAAVEIRQAEGDAVEVLQTQSLTADLVVIAQRDPQREGGLATAQAGRLLVGAACPVLAVPYIGWEHGQAGGGGVLQSVLVAWADTRESARAVRDALPLLARATRVEVVTFASGGADDVPQRRRSLEAVQAALARHGVQAEVTVLPPTARSVGERMLRSDWVPDVGVAEALLSHAAGTGADCIVMGAYGHSRLWELVLGGVTRSMLETMTVPVLMSR